MKEFLNDVKTVWPDMSLIKKAKYVSLCMIVGSLAIMGAMGIAGCTILMIDEVRS